ncbi:BatD family protein [Flammeovirga agarivorans]|uniref:Protein BatD n=1 Tax=Flammeovirga agarivorans TaxID=2726742 RepID=A0A7X8XXE6_9BACT|nr:BatD family protein [Flammeovirga agarivorans]NLR93020.1 protein BatD [Flammeovirga agarivorans]
MVKRIILSTFCLFWVMTAFAQKRANIFTTTTINKKEVMVGEPFKVKLSIYTTTWFTQGLNFEDFQLPNALMIKDGRAIPNSLTIGKYLYSGVEQTYWVFPFSAGENTFPSLTLEVQTPDPGDYKGKKRIVHTKEKTIKVVPPPLGEDPKSWLVASSVRIKDTWNKNLSEVKVGDVLKRTITITAGNTLGPMIPVREFDSLDWAGIYPEHPINSNYNNNEGYISGTQKQVVTYLVQEAGTFEVPGVTVRYYNPRTKKSKDVSSKDLQIVVEENPNLSMLASLQDSLNKLNQVPEEGTKTSQKTWKDYVPEQWKAILIGLIVLWLFYKIRPITRIRKRIEDIRSTSTYKEKHAYGQLRSAIKSGHIEKSIQHFYQWINTLPNQSVSNYKETLHQAVLNDHLSDLIAEISEIKYSQGGTVIPKKLQKALLHQLNWDRKIILQEKKKENLYQRKTKILKDLNP